MGVFLSSKVMTTTLAAEPAINLQAMADVVRALFAGGPARHQDPKWLRAQAEAAGLSDQVCVVLERMRLKLCDGCATLLDATAVLSWN
jgi:hypothetical protein